MSITLSEILGPNVSPEFLDAIKPIQGDLTARSGNVLPPAIDIPSKWHLLGAMEQALRDACRHIEAGEKAPEATLARWRHYCDLVDPMWCPKRAKRSA